ncbi:hypothetical protein A2767_02390 [Candidatus Roizmanbacteria bacterium RIFCSPHIGHO2_01_FULL_35_10]|uniref:Uncharacterized protein n=1 Tax=Candidatus Roizmanbacteria bacterium RIFCSPLOWO2_01_FULL_35_13 TaxID=1802055 RepID=A0A1F7I6Y0_9BACT|nr:MAG: hypothetical protein A2767_02390 [Candidatus Roizmanbacteria bacterium RIFCSPHIGHO2_01_FULL_35_10]OGK39129.1 MAG: hypothetical protein A3A74_08340 [Candidatus Roizmanbacteria bacterium RIFCSPLOWO2_01_FULL_35_13]
MKDVDLIWEYFLRLPETNILLVNEERDLEIIGHSNGHKQNIANFFKSILDPSIKNKLQDITLTIIFENALGVKYVTQIKSGKQQINISLQPKRLNWSKKVEILVNDTYLNVELKLYKLI